MWSGRLPQVRWTLIAGRGSVSQIPWVSLRSKWVVCKAVRAGLALKEHIWPIRRAVACSGHSTRFLTRPVTRVLAAFASDGLPEQATARRMDRHEDDHCRKNQKLFSKTSAQTAGRR
jgi:hypothetical protein